MQETMNYERKLDWLHTQMGNHKHMLQYINIPAEYTHNHLIGLKGCNIYVLISDSM